MGALFLLNVLGRAACKLYLSADSLTGLLAYPLSLKTRSIVTSLSGQHLNCIFFLAFHSSSLHCLTVIGYSWRRQKSSLSITVKHTGFGQMSIKE